MGASSARRDLRRWSIAFVCVFAAAVAVLPGTVQAQEAFDEVELLPDDSRFWNAFGWSVAISGDTMVVGAPQPDEIGPGLAYVFVDHEDEWVQAAELVASDAEAFEFFGGSVAIDGDTIVVGARDAGPGAAYVFERPPGGWEAATEPLTETVKLTNPSELTEVDNFGFAVAIDGGTIAVSSTLHTYHVYDEAGTTWVYEEPAGGWAEGASPVAKLNPRRNGRSFSARTGASLAIDGDTIIIGAPGREPGYVYVFEKPSGGWTGEPGWTAMLSAEVCGDDLHCELGASVAIRGDTIVAGATNFGAPKEGAAFVFVEPSEGWSGDVKEAARLSAAGSPGEEERFGHGVATDGDTVVVGADGNDEFRGAGYVYREPSGGWSGELTEDVKLTAAQRWRTGQLGFSVAFQDDLVVLGAPGDNVEDLDNPGSVSLLFDIGRVPQTAINSGPADDSVIADPTPRFSFSGTQSPTGFDCRIDGGAWEPCSTGSYESAGLADGEHIFEVRAFNDSGNDPTPAKRTFTVDATAPSTTIDTAPDDGAFVASHPEFAFSSADSGARFECRIDDGAFAACESPARPTGYGDGGHTFEVVAIDAVGNRDVTPATSTFVLDRVAPQTSVSLSTGLFNNPRPTFELSANEPVMRFECNLDDVGYTECEPNFRPDEELADGNHSLLVRAIDRAGNVDSSPEQRFFQIDTRQPVASFTEGPPDGAVINDPTPTFAFTSDELNSDFECQVDGGEFEDCVLVKVELPELIDGEHTFAVRAIDPAGNQGAAISRTFTVDTTAPVTEISGGPADGALIGEAPEFSFAADDLEADFGCKVDDGDFEECESPFAFDSLSDGEHTFAVRATDSVGNREHDPVVRSFTLTSARCNGLVPTIIASNGGPVRGTRGDDVIVGTSGADVIRSYAGDDVVCAGGGDDWIGTGKGANVVFAGAGDDVVHARSAPDRIVGGLGADRLFGGRGADKLLGGRGDDLLAGRAGADVLRGQAGDDTLRGARGHDRIHGNAGDDRLSGGPGRDRCNGGPGRNRALRCEV